jgi:hypothetical protein
VLHVTAVRHLAVPTGTAAATVIAREPSSDPVIEARRFLRLEALPDIAFRAHFEELIVSGVYTVMHNRVLVLRVIGGGTRRFAVVASESGDEAAAYPRAGLDTQPRAAAIAASVADDSGLRALVEAEARQRPVFHGVTPEGVTYSGFAALHSEALLQTLNAVRGSSERTAQTITVFGIGEEITLPAGLLVGLERARE